jgi:hypothetical protein
MVSPGYNQINIVPEDQHKTAFICPWGTFAYRKLPFGLKNVGATFQRAMSYSFHDIKHIVQPYLDDLPAHSMLELITQNTSEPFLFAVGSTVYI